MLSVAVNHLVSLTLRRCQNRTQDHVDCQQEHGGFWEIFTTISLTHDFHMYLPCIRKNTFYDKHNAFDIKMSRPVQKNWNYSFMDFLVVFVSNWTLTWNMCSWLIINCIDSTDLRGHGDPEFSQWRLLNVSYNPILYNSSVEWGSALFWESHATKQIYLSTFRFENKGLSRTPPDHNFYIMKRISSLSSRDVITICL